MLTTLPLSDRNLIITGYIGPNQRMMVRQLAERLKMPYINFESRLEERAELSIDDIRIHYGEARLKALEAEVVQEFALYRAAVIHISGQTVAHNGTYARLSETGTVLCLVASLDAVLQRVHLALGARYHDPRERALALGQVRREWAARKLDGICELDTTGMTEAQMVEAVAVFWQERVLLATRV